MIRRFRKKNKTEELIRQQQPTSSHKQHLIWPLSGYSRLIILLGVLLIVGLWMFAWQQINYDYDRSIQETSHEAMNLTKSLEEHVRRVVASADKDLSNLKKTYERGGISSPVLVENVKTAADGLIQKQVAVLNEQGIIVAAYFENRLGMDVSDREYFNVHRGVDTDMIYIGRPMIGSNNGQYIIPLSRRINKPDGSFGGVVVLGLQTEYLLQFYQKIDLGQNSLISLIGMDGVVRACQANLEVGSGQDVTDSYLWESILTRPNGTAITNNFQDKGGLITSYRVMPDYPLIVTVGESIQVALADYEKRKRLYIFGATLINLFIMAFCVLLVNRAAEQQAHKTKLEKTLLELQKSNVKLTEQAQLLELACDYIMVRDMNSNIIYWNRGAEYGYGWLASEATGQMTRSLLKTQFPVSVSAEYIMDRLLNEGYWEGELTHTHKDGKQVLVQSHQTLNRDAAGNPVSILEINHDISDRKKMETELARYDRLNLIGEMAASIGHEIRNPLTAVRGYLQHFQRKNEIAAYRTQF